MKTRFTTFLKFGVHTDCSARSSRKCPIIQTNSLWLSVCLLKKIPLTFTVKKARTRQSKDDRRKQIAALFDPACSWSPRTSLSSDNKMKHTKQKVYFIFLNSILIFYHYERESLIATQNEMSLPFQLLLVVLVLRVRACQL